MRTLGLRTLLFLIASMGVSAQTSQRQFTPWWDSPVSSALNLTDAQKKQIRSTVREFVPSLRTLRRAVDAAENDLSAVFNEDPVDQKKAGEAIEKLAASRGNLTRTLSQMDLKLRVILTEQQWQEAKKLELGPGDPHFGDRTGRSGSTRRATGTTNQNPQK